jgi:hypothetical protein
MPVALNSSGAASVTYIASAAIPGITISALYEGSTNFAGSESNSMNVPFGYAETLFAYEPFAESSSDVLNGKSGSGDSGWASPWSDMEAPGTLPGYDLASTTPLTYPGLLANGNYAIGGEGYGYIARQLDVSSDGPFSEYLTSGAGVDNGSVAPMIGAPGQTIWISFLLRKDVGDQESSFISLNSNGDPFSWWVEYPNISAGYFGADSLDINGNPFWSLQFGAAYTTPIATVQTNVPVVAGQPVLLVLSVNFGTDMTVVNTVNLYVNPTSLGGAPPTTPSATYTTLNSLAFQSLAYYGGDDTNESSLDEIRIGNSYAAVTPAVTP